MQGSLALASTASQVQNPIVFLVLDINECAEVGVCPEPGRCVNSLGSFHCACPYGFRLDTTGTFCVDKDECLDDSKCPEGCQNRIGGYRCGCPDGYTLHYYYKNQCVDENECDRQPCGGDGNCFNTLGSYRCGCPDGYQFDHKLSVCIQVSAGCANAPCAFGCTTVGTAGFSCGCPHGYQRIGQGHCLATVTPASVAYGEDIGNVPTYPIGGGGSSFRSTSNDKLITTEGCFSCKVCSFEKLIKIEPGVHFLYFLHLLLYISPSGSALLAARTVIREVLVSNRSQG